MDQRNGHDDQSREASAADAATEAAGLSERHREMLDFERDWWQYDEPRDDLIATRFGCSTDEYYEELNRVLDLPGAMLHDPLVVRRFKRRRVRRRRQRLADGGSVERAIASGDSSANRPTNDQQAGGDT